MKNQQDLFVQMALDAWNIQISRTNKLFDSLTDEQLAADVAPGRNSGIYLLGHLAAVHDGMLPLLRFGQKLRPEMEEVFIKNPDKSGLATPPVGELRKYWTTVNEVLASQFSKLSGEEWFERHAAISEEDFAKEPHRNRLNLVMNRTAHLANHLGQLTFLKPRG